VLLLAFELRDHLIAAVEDAVDLVARSPAGPAVIDDAVSHRQAARRQGGVSGAGPGLRVGVVAVGEPGAVLLEPAEAALAEEAVPAGQVIAAHLVEHHEDGEARGVRVLAARGVRRPLERRFLFLFHHEGRDGGGGVEWVVRERGDGRDQERERDTDAVGELQPGTVPR